MLKQNLILILGKTGQLGWELQRALAPLAHVRALGRDEADLSQPESLRQVLRHWCPSVVVNAAAYTAVDKAEAEPDLAEQINTVSPTVLAQEAQRLGAWLLHYSSDYVFDGSGSAPWREEDRPAPLNVYGDTKWRGELGIEQHTDKYVTLRTSWVYGTRGGNFAKTMRKLAREREELRVVCDQIGAPTGADLIADVTAHIIRQLITENHSESAGLYHLAAAGEASWFDYAKWVVANTHDSVVRHIEPISSSEFLSAARRPLNSRLDCNKVCTYFQFELPDWKDGVLRMLRETDSDIASE